MFKARSIVLALFLLVLINSSFSADEGSSAVQLLTNQRFIDNIFDYNNEDEWNFKGDLPCIITFSADWCGPCTDISPVLDELSVEFAGKMNVFLVDTEAEQELSNAFGIQTIPSILFIPIEGQPQMAMGALPRESFLSAIKDFLKVE
jgi:thioredoxin